MVLFRKYDETVPILLPYSYFRIIWNTVKILFFMTMIVVVPLPLTFDFSFDFLFHKDREYQIVRYLVTVLMLFDFLIKLNSTFYYNGELLKKRSMIIKTYFQNEFFSDIICFISFEYYAYTTNLVGKILLLNFYLKVFEIQKILSEINDNYYFKSRTEGLIRLSKLAIKILLIAHVFGCIWHAAGYYNLGYRKSWLERVHSLHLKSFLVQYVYSFYWAVTTIVTVGYGDIYPENEIEVLVAIFIILVGCGVFAYSLNSIGEIINDMTRDENEFRFYMRKLNIFLRNKSVSSELQLKIRKYLEYVWKEDENVKEIEENIMEKLSNSLRKQLNFQINHTILSKLEVLKRNFSEEFLSELVFSLENMKLSPNETYSSVEIL